MIILFEENFNVDFKYEKKNSFLRGNAIFVFEILVPNKSNICIILLILMGNLQIPAEGLGR